MATKSKTEPLRPIPNTKFWEGDERKPCVPFCNGCDRLFETKTRILFSENTDATEETDRVCRAYLYPALKWKDYHYKEVEGFKGKKVIHHFNPCCLATHVSHTLSEDEQKKINPIKLSKRKNR